MHYRSVWSTFIIYSSSSCCPVRAVEPARPTIEVRVFWVVWVCARSMRTLRNISYICQCRQVRTSIIYHNRWSHRDLYSVRCVHPSKSTLLTRQHSYYRRVIGGYTLRRKLHARGQPSVRSYEPIYVPDQCTICMNWTTMQESFLESLCLQSGNVYTAWTSRLWPRISIFRS